LVERMPWRVTCWVALTAWADAMEEKALRRTAKQEPIVRKEKFLILIEAACLLCCAAFLYRKG